MYQEVCFNRGTEAGGRGGNVGHSVSPPPPVILCLLRACYESDGTVRIGRHAVLLPINHNYNNFCDTLGFLNLTKKRNSESFFFFASLENSHLSARLLWPALSYYTVLLVLKSGQWTANQI